jgi:hypothetical protein
MNPEQMTNEELLKMYKGDPSLLSDEALLLLRGQQEPVKETQPAPVTEPQTDSGDFGRGFLQAQRDPIDAGAQLLPRALSTLFSAGGLLPNELSDFFRSEAERVDALVKEEEERYQKERGEKGFDTGRLIGNILNPANIAVGLRAVQGAKAVGKTGQAAISGGAVGALTPVTEEDFAEEKAKQIGIGAIGGVAGEKVIGAAGKVLAPGTKAIQEMRRLGVKGTIGQKLGGMFKSMEEFAKFIPLVGGAIDDRQATQIFNFNKGIIEDTLRKIDNKALINFNRQEDITEQAGIKGIKYLKDYLKKSYTNIFNSSDLKFNFNQKTARQLLNKLDKQGFDNADDIKEIQKFIDKEITERVFLSADERAIRQKGIEIIVPKEVNELTGKQFKRIDRLLRAKITNSFKAEKSELGNAYLAIKDTLTDNFKEQNKNVVYKTIDGTEKNAVENLDAINEGYSKLVAMIQGAGDLNIKNTAGLLTPESYRKALRNTDLSRNKEGYVFDTRPGAKESKEAVEMLGTDAEFYRGREALTRLGRFTTLGGVGAAGVAGAEAATTGGLGLIGGRLLYTEAGQELFDLILMSRPSFVRKAGEAVQRIPTGVRAVTGAELGQGMMSE